MENLVRRSYQYVAMYNTNNNFAMQEANPFSTNGWNKLFVPTGLMDDTVTAIPRPNNDTLYPIAMLDMRDDAIVIQFPAFDSKYVSLETSAYDHYIDIPLTTTKGDFKKPTTMLFYTSRTKNYKGEPIKGIDKTLKMTGDFAIAFLRVAPHASEPARMKRNLEAMQKAGVGDLDYRWEASGLATINDEAPGKLVLSRAQKEGRKPSEARRVWENSRLMS